MAHGMQQSRPNTLNQGLSHLRPLLVKYEIKRHHKTKYEKWICKTIKLKINCSYKNTAVYSLNIFFPIGHVGLLLQCIPCSAEMHNLPLHQRFFSISHEVPFWAKTIPASCLRGSLVSNVFFRLFYVISVLSLLYVHSIFIRFK